MAVRATIVDYGLGNLFSLQRALTHLGAEVEIATSPDPIKDAERLVLPGVGAFGDGMKHLRARGLVEPLREAAHAGRPLLGICLGMQLLFDESDEFGRHEGLRLLRGRVTRLADGVERGRPVKIPHMGWRNLTRPSWISGWESSVLRGLLPGEAMYFVHSFVPFPEAQDVTSAQIEYGGHRYSAMVEQRNVMGSQFHPEKSGEAGLRLLRNFLEWS